MSENRRWDLSAESVTALMAVAAAIIALWVGVWENVQMRRHNRLSVTPYVNFTIELRTPPDSTATGVVWMVNQGVGPAVIESMDVVLRSPSAEARRYPSWTEATPALEGLGMEVRAQADMSGGAMLSAGERLKILEFTVPGPMTPTELQRLVGHVGVVVDYRSIYGDEFQQALDTE